MKRSRHIDGTVSSIDYGLIAIIGFATSFFGAFGKELAEELIRWFRTVRSKIRTNGSKIRPK